jgi:glycosyltransferase involved in cell wall biosynthesis
MDWEPNIDAVEYFCRQIFPQVRSRIPGAVLEIVGRDPHPRVQRLTAESVVVTGTVPSVQERIEPAAVVVVPLRVGGGTRLKIFEAMAMGKAVVSTSVGAEGLELENGHDLVIADNPTAFADAVVLLLQNDALRRKYEEAALATARKHDWSFVVTQFADVLRKVMLASPGGRSMPAPVHQ